jgi:hypothetical protein
MSQIDYEDRTTESPETAVHRQVEAASYAIIGTAITASQGNPAIGLGALALALGQVIARTGASLDDVIEAIKTSRETALSNQTTRTSDA